MASPDCSPAPPAKGASNRNGGAARSRSPSPGARRDRSRSRSPGARRDRSRSRSPGARRDRSRSRSPALGRYGLSSSRGGGRKTGVAGRWNSRGFGFIIPDHGGEDVFCHLSAITDGNMVRHQSDPEHRIYCSFTDSANRHGP